MIYLISKGTLSDLEQLERIDPRNIKFDTSTELSGARSSQASSLEVVLRKFSKTRTRESSSFIHLIKNIRVKIGKFQCTRHAKCEIPTLMTVSTK